jgi:hypothetical protein
VKQHQFRRIKTKAVEPRKNAKSAKNKTRISMRSLRSFAAKWLDVWALIASDGGSDKSSAAASVLLIDEMRLLGGGTPVHSAGSTGSL